MHKYIHLLALIVLVAPGIALGAIQFDFMSEPAALSEAAAEVFVSKVREIDVEKVKEDVAGYVDEIPEPVKEAVHDAPDQVLHSLEESGIDAGGVFSHIYSIFSDLFSFAIGLFSGE